jgi:hypothetical protein
MHRQHWFSHSKGAKKKGGNGKKEADDDIGEFGAEFESASVSNSTNRWQPQKIFKGPNSVTIQLSSPSTFAIEGRNKKIRDTIKAMVGSRLGTSFYTFYGHLRSKTPSYLIAYDPSNDNY